MPNAETKAQLKILLLLFCAALMPAVVPLVHKASGAADGYASVRANAYDDPVALDPDGGAASAAPTATLSISNPGNLTLGTISGSGSANGSLTWAVVTNNNTGYALTLQAGGVPAMTLTTGGDSFADFAGPAPWSVAAANSAFGFSLPDNPPNYQGFNGSTPIEVDRYASRTSGRNTTVGFRAEVGAGHVQTAGNYSATVVATAVTL